MSILNKDSWHLILSNEVRGGSLVCFVLTSFISFTWKGIGQSADLCYVETLSHNLSVSWLLGNQMETFCACLLSVLYFYYWVRYLWSVASLSPFQTKVENKCTVFCTQSLVFGVCVLLFMVWNACGLICTAAQGGTNVAFIPSLHQKATIHQLTTMLATYKNVLFSGHNHLLTTGTDDPTLSPECQRVKGHQYRWLALK